jgi:hypothetical protein
MRILIKYKVIIVKEYKIIIILSKKLILLFAINSAFKIRVVLKYNFFF